MKYTSSLRFSGKKKNQNKRFFDSENLQNTRTRGFFILKIFKKTGSRGFFQFPIKKFLNQRLFLKIRYDHPTTGIYPVQAEKLANIRLVWCIKSQRACCTRMSFRQNPM